MFGAGSLMYFPKATKEEKKKKNPGAHGQACPNTVLHLWNRSSTYVLCICMTMYVHFICIYTLLHNLLHLWNRSSTYVTCFCMTMHIHFTTQFTTPPGAHGQACPNTAQAWAPGT